MLGGDHQPKAGLGHPPNGKAGHSRRDAVLSTSLHSVVTKTHSIHVWFVAGIWPKILAEYCRRGAVFLSEQGLALIGFVGIHAVLGSAVVELRRNSCKETA